MKRAITDSSLDDMGYLSGSCQEGLEPGTRKAKDDLDATIATLDAGQRRAKAFFAEIEALKAGSPA